jgi:predicted aspartyl protease
LEAEAVQENPGMIVGMFPVDSHIVEVLFDTGATHSFITAPWVEAHNLPITIMSTPIQIDSAGGRIRADSICLNVSVEVRGIAVAEPPELFQLKCPSRTFKGSNTL